MVIFFIILNFCEYLFFKIDDSSFRCYLYLWNSEVTNSHFLEFSSWYACFAGIEFSLLYPAKQKSTVPSSYSLFCICGTARHIISIVWRGGKGTLENKELQKQALEEKKNAKRIRMIDAAYHLFINKGVHATAIDEVVKKAGVAKGTFYLYFHDKYDLLDQIVLYKSTVLVQAALRELGEKYRTEQPPLEDGILFFASRLIDSLEENHDLVLLIHKKLSASLSVMEYLRDGELGPIVDSVMDRFVQRGKSRTEAEQTLYIIIEMTSSVCCDAILYQKPYPLSEIKPTLYAMIRKMLN